MKVWLAALIALPKILELGLRWANLLERRLGPDWDKKLNDHLEFFEAVKEATTDAERLEALRNLVNR